MVSVYNDKNPLLKSIVAPLPVFPNSIFEEVKDELIFPAVSKILKPSLEIFVWYSPLLPSRISEP
jgi:hypothetical protein